MRFYLPFAPVVFSVVRVVILSPVQSVTGQRYDTIPGNLELENNFDLLAEDGGFVLLEN